MLFHKVKSFLHSGDRGDLVYALPTIRLLGGGTVYLNTDSTDRRLLEDGTISLFTEEKIVSLLPLLKSQSYIKHVSPWKNQSIDYNLDIFRRCRLDITNLADAHLQAFGLSLHEKDQAWLTVTPKPEAEVVVARSPRYHNHAVNWKEIYTFIRSRAVFIGSHAEHDSFQNSIGIIPHFQTKDLLEAAEVIAGARLFIGNQSCPFAIAEGLKQNAILEACPRCPNCLFRRKNVLHLWQDVSATRLEEWEQRLS